MAKEPQQTPGRIKRWREKLKLRDERAREISQRVGTARRQRRDYDSRGGGDGPGVGGAF
jgi:hypothetical protein